MERHFFFQNFIHVVLNDKNWPGPARRNVVDYWKAHQIEANQVPDDNVLHLEVSMSESVRPPKNAVNIDNQIFLSEDTLYQRIRYKIARFSFCLTGLREMEGDNYKLRLDVSGNYPSHWVWPFQVFINIIRWLAILRSFVLLHGLGVALPGKNAALLLGASGTGKTLTSLAWLANNRQYYGDDTVLVNQGRLYGFWKPINLWFQRYQDNNALEAYLPDLTAAERVADSFHRLIRSCSFGAFQVATSVFPGEKYIAPFALSQQLTKIVVLRHGDTLQVEKECAPAPVAAMIKADLLLESINVMRWQESLAMLDPSHPLASWLEDSNKIIESLVYSSRIAIISLPRTYGPGHFEKIQAILLE